MHWLYIIMIYCLCLYDGYQIGVLNREVATLMWEVRRVECKANGMEWVPDKDYPVGHCRTPSVAGSAG